MAVGRLIGLSIVSVLLAAACSKADEQAAAPTAPPGPTAAPAPTAAPTTPTPSAGGGMKASDLTASVGKVVRVKGIVQRDKLGDVITVDGVDVMCGNDVRFPDDKVGQEGEASGTLELRSMPRATRGPKGEISQGVEGDEVQHYVLAGCTVH